MTERRPAAIARKVVYALTVPLGVAAILAALVLIKLQPDRRVDFQIFYQSALSWRQGNPIYPELHVNLNLPAIVVAYAPFTYVSQPAALEVFTLIGIACVILACRWITRAFPIVPWWVLASVVLAVDGGWTNLWLGQEGLILMLVVTAAWLADRQGRELPAGIWTGVAVYTKPFLAGLVIYWAWRRQWRRVAVATLSGGTMVLLGGVLAGPASYLSWWKMLANGPAPYAPLNASLLGLWSRLFLGSEFAPPLLPEQPRVLMIVWGLSVAVLVISIYGRLVVANRDDVDLAWALILLGSLLASPLGWIYYLPLAVGPLLARLGGFRSWLFVWVSAAVLLVFRSELIVHLHTTARGAIGIGSVHVWVLLLLFAAAWSGVPQARPVDDAGFVTEGSGIAPLEPSAL